MIGVPVVIMESDGEGHTLEMSEQQDKRSKPLMTDFAVQRHHTSPSV